MGGAIRKMTVCKAHREQRRSCGHRSQACQHADKLKTTGSNGALKVQQQQQQWVPSPHLLALDLGHAFLIVALLPACADLTDALNRLDSLLDQLTVILLRPVCEGGGRGRRDTCGSREGWGVGETQAVHVSWV